MNSQRNAVTVRLYGQRADILRLIGDRYAHLIEEWQSWDCLTCGPQWEYRAEVKVAMTYTVSGPVCYIYAIEPLFYGDLLIDKLPWHIRVNQQGSEVLEAVRLSVGKHSVLAAGYCPARPPVGGRFTPDILATVANALNLNPSY